LERLKGIFVNIKYLEGLCVKNRGVDVILVKIRGWKCKIAGSI
jgi:hypothetical protein